ncbi:fibronectin type III domain-containing protein [uncultured Chryseobacterium sp.]|uniref:fibronectin type III domain-containing protein n=1 Tax=uncultured Chryseobacterium sp. TaxID=259322 RepID=UPI0025F60D48|nr:fibronectin type III domain-containing protein [uncultured Chryseobacterium sp.]
MKKLLLYFLSVLASCMASAQVASYAFAQSSGTYVPITGGTVLATATNASDFDSQNWTLPTGTIPFGFNFNGAFYTGLNINSNGYITFGSTIPPTYITTPINSATNYSGAISAFGGDLNASYVAGVIGSELRYETLGTAPNRTFVVQFKEWRPFSNASTTAVAKISFQIRLEETTNKITMVYNDCSIAAGSLTNSASRQIGLRGANANDFNNRMNATTVSFNSSTAGTTNGAAQSFSFNTATATPGLPANGLTYTWTPPSCFAPSDISQTAASTSTASVNWRVPVPTPGNGYEYYYSIAATPPTSATAPMGASTASNASFSGLATGTTYNVWVRSLCDATNTSAWSAAGTFTTLCNSVATLTENFDTYTTGNIVPPCWSKIVTGNNAVQAIALVSGTNKNITQYNNIAGEVNIVLLPPLNTVNAGYQLKFKVRANYATVLDVGYLTNAFDAGSFVTVQSLNVTNTAYGNNTNVPFPTTVPADARVAVRMPAQATAATVYWDDVSWEQAAVCIEPNSLTVSNITQTAATVSWNAPVTVPANGYEYYYSTSNTTPASTTAPLGTSTGTSVTLGLSSSTTYYVWVRSACSGSVKSDWSPAATFTTLCDAVATLYENFDSYAIAAIVPSCWDRLVLGNAANQAINSSTPASGTRNLYQVNSVSGQTSIVILPPLSTINSGYRLRFKVRASLPAILNVGYMTNPADESTFVNVQSLNISNTTYGSESLVPFPASVPANARVAVRMPVQTNSPSVYWDDVYWESAPSLGTSETAGHKNTIASYPNPFSDVLYISDVKNVRSMAVTDITGKMVKTFDTPSTALHLDELPSGMYLVVLYMNDGTKQTIKAIKK